MGKSAQELTGFGYPAGGTDNDIGVYRQPQPNPSGNMTASVTLAGNCMDHNNISVGGISKGNYAKENPYGTGTMKGYGAATKGRKISGKQG